MAAADTLERIALANFSDPATDDLTVPLAIDLAAAEQALTRAGYTKLDGAAEWKPPLGPPASPLLDEIDRLRKDLDRANDLLGGDELLERVALLSITFAQQQDEIARLRAALLTARPFVAFFDNPHVTDARKALETIDAALQPQ